MDCFPDSTGPLVQFAQGRDRVGKVLLYRHGLVSEEGDV